MTLTQISTAGVKDDAVTSGKIPANAVGSSELADNAVDTAAIADDAVTTAKIADNAVTFQQLSSNTVKTGNIEGGAVTTDRIADQAITLDKLVHGTSSNDGKFLRANNGADPTFETVSGTTINNNANNRIITGSSTANTLEGEANLTYDGGGITLTGTNPYIDIVDSNNDSDFTLKNDNGTFEIEDKTNSSTARLAIDSSGNCGIGTTSPDQKLHVHKGSAGSIDSTANSVLTLENSNDAILQFLSPSNKVNQIRFGDPSDNGAGYIDYDHNTNRLAFGTAGPERMRLSSAGELIIGGTTLGAAGSFSMESSGHVRSVLASGTTGDTLFGAISGVSNGFQVNISGTNVQRYSFHNGSTVTARIDSDGLKFMNDTAAANALDDYEEGTWTPSFDTNTASSTSGNCKYVKIGKVVHCFFRAIHPTTSSSSYATITDLPFTCHGFSVGVPGGAFAETNAGQNLSMIVNPNQTFAYILRCNNSGVAVVTQSSISGKDFRGCITYFTT